MKRWISQLIVRAFLLEGIIFGVALLWAYWRTIPLQQALQPTLSACLIGIVVGVFVLVFNYVIIEYGSRYVTALRIIHQLIEQDIFPIFKHFGITGALCIAIISGFAEEFFFRGVLQAQIGIWLASLVFGLVHIWSKPAIIYGVYTALIGLLFGGLYLWIGNLWSPILAHMVNNFVAILYYRHSFAPS
ncbi:hypothetical protein CSA56_02835 [candidate division KSB3 bacterium]|uniref:CAAX prenyl protease 2/Lysostaphin resistance protein A-like domain-containing protein n=1 Tax=candidate division KSB3 bacterium TaxID=2044937 RepID=A0A2G6KJE1_9BACT|nr:MAG: hypothetical protein CSA56_02835 [candidate division KSB3 bacterium]